MPGADEVTRNLRDWAARRRAAVIALAQVWAGTLEARAKIGAPWRDHTGHARQGLVGSTYVASSKVVIALGHSVEYGAKLELMRDGKYAILKPTLDKAAPEIYATYKRLWEEG